MNNIILQGNIKKNIMNVVGNLKDNPTSMFAINIYLGIMIFLVSFYFFYYISWDIGKKRITTCNNVINNIKKFSEKKVLRIIMFLNQD